MNYKRKKTGEKKLVEYGSPKEYQKKTRNPNGNPSKKPANYCIKLKKKHDFIRTGAEPVRILGSDTVFVYKKCRGCFKQKIEETTREAMLTDQAGVL